MVISFLTTAAAHVYTQFNLEKIMTKENVLPEDCAEMLKVCENSVRATHDFTTEEDIEFFKPIIMEHAFPAVSLKCVKNECGSRTGSRYGVVATCD